MKGLKCGLQKPCIHTRTRTHFAKYVEHKQMRSLSSQCAEQDEKGRKQTSSTAAAVAAATSLEKQNKDRQLGCCCPADRFCGLREGILPLVCVRRASSVKPLAKSSMCFTVGTNMSVKKTKHYFKPTAIRRHRLSN